MNNNFLQNLPLTKEEVNFLRQAISAYKHKLLVDSRVMYLDGKSVIATRNYEENRKNIRLCDSAIQDLESSEYDNSEYPGPNCETVE